MDMQVAMGLVKVLKGNNVLYKKVHHVFETGKIDAAIGKELVSAAKEHGIELAVEDLLDDLDELLRNGMNGISIKELGGLDGIMEMADGLMG